MNTKHFLSNLACTVMLITFSSFRVFTSGGYAVGDKVSDFKLKNVDGKMVSLSDYKDAKGFIVVFTCNHCPFAKAYESRIMKLNEKYAKLGYPVMAINPNDKDIAPDDSYDEMVSRAKSKGYKFPYLYDESQQTAMAYGASRTPHIYVLQKQGTDLMVKYIGAIDDNADDENAAKQHYVEDAVNSLIAGKDVPVNFTKAIGCTIKWRKVD